MAKLTLKETKEMHSFIMGVLASAEAAKEDGKVSSMEWMQTAITNAPAAVKAFMGIDQIDDEMKDLDDKEMAELASMGIQMLKGFATVLSKK